MADILSRRKSKCHTGEDGKTYYRTKAFKGGTKVYLDSKFYPSEETQISVIGMNRRGRFIIDTIPTKLIENVRFQIIYKMAAMDVMDNAESLDGWRWWGRTAKDKREAQAFAKNWYRRER